ncbi:multicopper oxidase family protein [Cohnella algarum]|uniref:multicopper oxidase family protein n=1 Tax=Cohnella algarum TaxID=2044859 RepID=UPI0019674312|nr:multicopper oxidase family protein [Cohnella algarum]MBN2981757.1 multicopper oxidase family protein [Cohnella algarum]
MIRKNRKIFVVAAIAISLILILAGCTNGSGGISGMDHSNMDMGQSGASPSASGDMANMESGGAPEVLTGTKFTLTAQENHLMVNETNMRTAMTFNGTVPGPQIRVKLGDDVEITLKNELDVPTTIHWHGLPVPNNMDGIPGVTMNAVQPGESFTYKFNANVPGTYWYHSHQDGVVQLDKGLYGSFIVEDPDEQKPDRDYTLVLDDWMEDGEMDHGSMDMSGMDHGNMDMDSSDNGMAGMSDAEMMPMMYTIFTANGKSGSSIAPLTVKEGETVRIRLINAGFLSHPLYLQGHEFKIVSTDGQPINNPPLVNGQLLNVAPGERYDIEFVANNPGAWMLAEQSPNPGAPTLAIPIVYEGVEGDAKRDNEQRTIIDMTQYGEAAQSEFSLNDKFDLEYTMDLNTVNAGGNITYTINGKSFPETEPMMVQEGDLVKVKLINNSPKDVHPMHLHGHFFQVLSKNGQPVAGSPLMKDTLNVLPGEEYEIAFKADNSGNWMFHCHDLGHASKGMVTQVNYEGFTPDFTVDPNAGNKPE